jgi:DNA polymerase-1
MNFVMSWLRRPDTYWKTLITFMETEEYEIITTLEGLKDFTKRVRKEFTFDTEGTGLNYHDTMDGKPGFSLTGISIYDSFNKPTFIQFNFSALSYSRIQDPNNKRRKIDSWNKFVYREGIDYEDARPYITQIFDKAIVCAHNAKYDYKMAHKYGFNNFILKDDTMIMSYLLDVNTPNGLKDNVNRILGIKMTELDELIDMEKPDWFALDFKKYGIYACDDAYRTQLLREKFLPQIEQAKLTNTYYQIEMPIIIPVAEMEIRGVLVNSDILRDLSVILHKERNDLAEDIFTYAGVRFNIGSNKQLAEVLFDRMQLPVIGLTDTGQRSVNDDSLKELAFRGYDIADLLIDCRKIDKLISTYCDKIPTMVDINGFLHGSFNQIGTKTGRFSSSNPNMQNVPKEDTRIRRAYEARPGYKLIVLDWSMIEVRVMAHESQDPVLTKLLNEGADLHQATADKVGKLAGVDLTRQQGKTLNFGIIYGLQGDSLAYMLNMELKKKFKKGLITREELDKQLISVKQAQAMVDGYLAAYNGYSRWAQQEVQRAQANNCVVRTLGGRARQVLQLKNKKEYGAGFRRVINTKIQGGAGDLMKYGIQKIYKEFEARGWDAMLLMVVHDEFVIEAREDIMFEVYDCVVDIMRHIFPKCRVPIDCDGGIFDNWGKKGRDYMKPEEKKKVNKNTQNYILWQKQQKRKRALQKN